VAGSSALGRLTIAGSRPEHFVQGGRAMQRVWLEATALKLGFQPMTALLYLFMRCEAGGDGLNAGERDTLALLRAPYLELLPVESGQSELMLFRISLAEPPSVRARRRPIEAISAFVPA
jgi:hypothetical protein